MTVAVGSLAKINLGLYIGAECSVGRKNPKLHAAVESHPNVEKHDVRMGHPVSLRG
jgi:hypothetical protein